MLRKILSYGALVGLFAGGCLSVLAITFASRGMLAWGEFNNHFELKEYLEAYVAEPIAREQLRDPALKAEFERRLREDAKFAADPAARLEFFHRRHASWDDRYRRYPVLRSDETW